MLLFLFVWLLATEWVYALITLKKERTPNDDDDGYCYHYYYYYGCHKNHMHRMHVYNHTHALNYMYILFRSNSSLILANNNGSKQKRKKTPSAIHTNVFSFNQWYFDLFDLERYEMPHLTWAIQWNQYRLWAYCARRSISHIFPDCSDCVCVINTTGAFDIANYYILNWLGRISHGSFMVGCKSHRWDWR